jgi:hypothetical protein
MHSVLPCLCFLGIAANAYTLDEGVTPVQKVIQMLEDMKTKGIKEKDAEVVAFTAYKQFCVSTDAEKKKAIKDGAMLIVQLKASIEKAAADAMSLGKEIDGLSADIDAFTADKDKATEVRNKEHADFSAIHADYTDAIGAVDRALDTLKAGPGLASAALIQLSAMKGVTASAKKVIEAYLQPEGESFLQTGAPEARTYESSSGAVIDMVKDLGKKFEAERYEIEKAEATKQGNYDMLAQELTDNIDRATKQSNLKSKTKGERLQSKGDDETSFASTHATLIEDGKYLQDLTVECEQKAIDFDKRQELRQGEIDAIQKAIDIMGGDAVSGGTQHLPSLVQTSLVQLRASSSHSTAQKKVADFLKSKAKLGGSRILALVAAKAEFDPFKKVVKMIKDMITKLTEEANDEAEHKAFCDTEMSTNKATRDAKTSESETLQAEIDKLTADTTKLAEEIASLVAAMAENDAAVLKATTIREEEKAKNTATIADAKAAAAATARALSVLKTFYEKASQATALVQVPGAPASFNKPYTGMGGSSTGVVGMLEVIQSDFVRLDSETTAAEEEAVEAYKQFMADSAEDKTVKDEDRKQKSMTKQKKDFDLNSAKEDLTGVQEELSAAIDYYEKLKPSCVDSVQSYAERVAQREEEMESLNDALNILNEQA